VFFHGKVVSLMKRCGLSVYCQLHITFPMSPTKNYKRAFEFVEVIIRTLLSFKPKIQ